MKYILKLDEIFLYIHLGFIFLTLGIGPATVIIFTLFAGVSEGSIIQFTAGILYTAHLIYTFYMGEKPSRTY